MGWCEAALSRTRFRARRRASHDGLGRVQNVDVMDPISGAILDRAELEQFGEGVWLEYEIKEGADIRVTRQTGPNAVFSGVFFD